MAISLEARLSLQDRLTSKLTRSARAVKGYGAKWTDTGRTVQKAARGMSAAIRKVGAAANRVARYGFTKLGRAARRLWTSVKFGSLLLGGLAVRSALQYADSLRQVTSLMASAGAGTDELNAAYASIDSNIRRMATDYGQAPVDLARGLYDVYSATFTGAEGMHILDIASKGAIATLTDTEVTAGLLTKTLQAFRKENETNAVVAGRSATVMDQYMAAVERGMFKLPQLAEMFPEVLSMAGQFGIPLEQLLAVTSAATRRGVGLEEVTTGLRALLVSQASIGPQQEKAAEELFGKDWKKVWGPGALAESGIAGMLDALDKGLGRLTPNMLTVGQALTDDKGPAEGMSYLAAQIGVTTEALTALFPNIRALKPVMALQGPGLRMFQEDLDRIANATGSVNRAQEEMERSPGYWMKRMRSMWQVLSLDLGALAFPAITTAGESLSRWMEDLPIRSALESGDYEKWMGEGLNEAEIGKQAQDRWDSMDPWGRLYQVITIGWEDLSARLAAWYEADGAATMEKAGAGVGKALSTLVRVSWDDVFGDGSLFQTAGKSAATGIRGRVPPRDGQCVLGRYLLVAAGVLRGGQGWGIRSHEGRGRHGA